MDSILDSELRAILEHLAEALLPLQRWLARPERYLPPTAPDLPWRQGRPLTHERVGTVACFEALLRGSSHDALLTDRWKEVGANPFVHCPLAQPEQWRAARGLEASATFAITAGDNALADAAGTPISRAGFYAQFWPVLRAVVGRRQPADAGAWEVLAQELHQDQCPEWPTWTKPRSSLFIAQLVPDFLYALLNMVNRVEEPWRTAVLVELGEFRRVGNQYSRADVKRALDDLIATLEAVRAPEGHVGLMAVPLVDEATTVADPARQHYLEFHAPE